MVASILDPGQAQFLDLSKYTNLSKKDLLLQKIEEYDLSRNDASINSLPSTSTETNMVIFFFNFFYKIHTV